MDTLYSDDYDEYIFRDGIFARKALENLEDYNVIPIDGKWAVVSIRNNSEGMTEYGNSGYSTVPLLYGLTDLGAVNESGILQIRQQPVLGLNGGGTCVAVIDTGINWRHLSFVNSNNTSKIKVLWDQETDRIYNTKMINNGLTSASADIPGDETGHGTYMAGIACGNADSAGFFSGVAPEAGLIVVKVRQAKKRLKNFYLVRDDVPAYSETDIMRAVSFVREYAEHEGIPVSIVIGMGTSLGSHSGASPLGNMIADIAGMSGYCITLPSGNEGNERLHFHGNVNNGSPVRAEIRTGRGEKGFILNGWSKAPYIFTVELISPSGQIVSRVPAHGETVKLDFPFEGTGVYIYYGRYEGISGANVITMRFESPAEGNWILNFYCNYENEGEIDLWIMNRSFMSGGTFFLSSDVYTTITDPGNLAAGITVSAYDYKDDSFYLENGRGNNWYGIVKPDFAAPGVDILVPSNTGNSGYSSRSGSSVAAAFYAGMAALLLEYGIVRGNIPYIRTNEIRNITINGCERIRGFTYPNREWGYGKVNLYNALDALRN